MLWFTLGYWNAEEVLACLEGRGWGEHQMVDWDGTDAVWFRKNSGQVDAFIPDPDAGWIWLSTHTPAVRTLPSANAVRSVHDPGTQARLMPVRYADPDKVIQRLVQAHLYFDTVLKA